MISRQVGQAADCLVHWQVGGPVGVVGGDGVVGVVGGDGVTAVGVLDAGVLTEVVVDGVVFDVAPVAGGVVELTGAALVDELLDVAALVTGHGGR